MNSRKPDALLVLAIIFGLGILVSTLTHSTDEGPAGAYAAGVDITGR